MPKLPSALEPNAPKRPELAWEVHYRGCVVKLADHAVGKVPGAEVLADGSTMQLISLLQGLPTIRRPRRTDAQPPVVGHPAR